ncbi:hypothetical protein ABG768_017301 [Culter alburnus]|uniref:Interleukin-7 n=1 Tax=Culter alburnus TaxID=194366 RepID=A0AAW1YVU9_CULAL
MHRLGTSVLTLIILPLAFSCESGHNKTQIIEDYRNVIQKQLKHVEASIEELYSNCTIRNVSKSKEPRNAQHNIHRKICRVNGKLRRYESEPDNVNGQLKDVLYKLVEEIHVSLRCWCQRKRKRQMRQIRKWKPCKVKDILVNLQSYFEQYNAYHSLST